MATSFGRVIPLGEEMRSGNVLDTTTWFDSSEKFAHFKALIRVESDKLAKWVLTIRDAKYRVIDTLSDKSLNATASTWTKRISLGSGAVYFDFEQIAGTEAVLKITKVIAMPTDATNPFYSVQTPGAEQYRDVADDSVSPRTKRLADLVGMQVGSIDSKVWCCTAVAIGPDLVMTNWHCGGVEHEINENAYWSESICERTSFDFSWDGDKIDREFQCDKVLQADRALDIAIIKVKPRNGTDQLRFANRWANVDPKGAPLIVIQHPACKPKKVASAGTCVALASDSAGTASLLTTDFQHTCDTMNGSSGAPLFDFKYRFVGLHHLGFEFDKTRLQCDKKNKAIHAGSILNALHQSSKQALGAVPVIEAP